MLKRWISLLFMGCVYFSLHAQTPMQTATRFLTFLNAYQKDSLENIITEDFHIKRTFATYTTQRADFLSFYLPFSQNLDAVFTILKADSAQNPIILEVADNSLMIQYMKLEKPIWRMSIYTKENKVSSITLDTTSMSRLYLQQVQHANETFAAWLKTHHPTEKIEDLYPQKGLLIERLTAFMKAQE